MYLIHRKSSFSIFIKVPCCENPLILLVPFVMAEPKLLWEDVTDGSLVFPIFIYNEDGLFWVDFHRERIKTNLTNLTNVILLEIGGGEKSEDKGDRYRVLGVGGDERFCYN
jgi:hypothetical protein